MSNSFDLTVYYHDQKHTFHIGKDLQSLNDIRKLISESFEIETNNFIIEIFDETYKSYFTLDRFYFEEFLTDPFQTKDKMITARIRSQEQSAFSMVYGDDDDDGCQLSTERHIEIDELHADHIVIWLDQWISEPGAYNDLKKNSRSMIACDEHGLFSELYDDEDIDSLILLNNQVDLSSLINPNGKLYFFSEIDQCMQFINDISEKKYAIFLIIDDKSIQRLLPQIFDNVYIKKIYIFLYYTYSIRKLVDDILDYIDKVNIFDHETDLIARLVRDIGRYYMRKSSFQSQNPRLCLLFLRWARIFYEKANRIGQERFLSTELKSIAEKIHKLEELHENAYN